MTNTEAINALKNLGYPSVMSFQKAFMPTREQDGKMGAKTRLVVENVMAFKGIKHFKPHEFKCKCGGKYCTGYPAVVDKQLLKNLDYLRGKSGAITVTSGLRCKKHNANVGGATSSRHMTGKAADIKGGLTSTKTKRQSLVKRWRTFKQNRYAYSDKGSMGQSVHLDVK